MYVSSKKAQEYYNVASQTLRQWANEGHIKVQKTTGGHNRFFIPEEKKDNKFKKIIYARVSSKKQKSDLERQVQYLKNKYPKYTIIKDIGSGINFKRRGFNTILEQVFEGNVETVVVFSKDRLARFAQELIENIFEHFHTQLIVENDDNKSDQEELAEDVISIITVFSARYYGKRKYNKNNKNNKKIQNKAIKRIKNIPQ